MLDPTFIESDLPATPDEIDRALAEFQAGRSDALDLLLERLDGGLSNIGAAFDGLVHLPRFMQMELPALPGYRVLNELGRGGMGWVLQAIQENTNREVAVKLLPIGFRSRDESQRLFQRELRMLARLNHPNIATLYDVGHTADGHPVLVMEYVRGVTLDTYCEDRIGLTGSVDSRRALLKIFIEICRAIAFAHVKGVVHCDLKPHNVMIDNAGKPKVLDFGLARLLDADAGVSIGMSMSGTLVGTLAYLSPEQADSDNADIDTRCDVYALGVMLYELLLGRLPHEVRGLTLAAAARAICEEPVTRPRRLDAQISSDLETILLKALEKDVDRRYQSANELADDLERYLQARPIAARPPSPWYLARRFASRHRVATGLVLTLVMVITVAVWQIASNARRIARERDKALAVSSYLSEIISDLDANHYGSELNIESLLTRLTDSLDSSLIEQPLTRAGLYEQLGDGWLILHRGVQATRCFRAAVDLRKSSGDTASLDYARVLTRYALMGDTQFDRFEELVREAYEIRKSQLPAKHPDIADSLEALSRINPEDVDGRMRLLREATEIRRATQPQHPDLIRALGDLGQRLVEAGRDDEAIPVLTELLDRAVSMPRSMPLDMAEALTDLGEIYQRRGDYELAEEAYRRQLELLEPQFPDGHNRLGFTYNDLASVMRVRSDYQSARELYEKALSVTDGDESLVCNDYGIFLMEIGELERAHALLRKVYEWWYLGPRRRGHPPIPGNAYGLQNYARILLAQGDLSAAEPLFEEAAGIWRDLYGTDHVKLAVPMIGLAQIRERRGEPEAAHQLYLQAYQIRRRLNGIAHQETAEAGSLLSVCEARLDNPDAVERARDLYHLNRAVWGLTNPQAAWTAVRYAEVLMLTGDQLAAAQLVDEIIEIQLLCNVPCPPLIEKALSIQDLLKENASVNDGFEMPYCYCDLKVRFGQFDKGEASSQPLTENN